jgi:hypothetical protein
MPAPDKRDIVIAVPLLLLLLVPMFWPGFPEWALGIFSKLFDRTQAFWPRIGIVVGTAICALPVVWIKVRHQLIYGVCETAFAASTVATSAHFSMSESGAGIGFFAGAYLFVRGLENTYKGWLEIQKHATDAGQTESVPEEKNMSP